MAKVREAVGHGAGAPGLAAPAVDALGLPDFLRPVASRLVRRRESGPEEYFNLELRLGNGPWFITAILIARPAPPWYELILVPRPALLQAGYLTHRFFLTIPDLLNLRRRAVPEGPGPWPASL